jgi:GTP cyclohydrolase I
MNAPEQRSVSQLPDVQSESDPRAIDIQKVGIRGIKHPLKIKSQKETFWSVVQADMTVSLDANVKGTHMSRFIEVLQEHKTPISNLSLLSLGDKMLERLDATSGWIMLKFPYFVEKIAPVSNVKSLMDYEVTWEINCFRTKDNVIDLKVVVPVTSLCPCSKNISEYGAHNQRSHISISISLIDFTFSVEEIIKIAESAASCELWGLLKRPDEKYVTEKAYDNPKFVEDLVRDVAVCLKSLIKQKKISGFSVESENFESIHNHSAFARVENNF